MTVKQYVYPHWLQEHFKALEISPKLLASISGQAESLFRKSQDPWPMETYLTLFEWAADYLSEPQLGIKLAKKARIEDFGLYGFLVTSAETLEEFLDLSQNYQPLLVRGEDVEIHEQQGCLEIRLAPEPRPEGEFIQDGEFTIALWIRIIQTIYQKDWRPRKVYFSHTKTDLTEEHYKLFGEHIEFQQTYNSILFNKSLLKTPLSKANPVLLQILKDQANQQLKKINIDSDLLTQVQQLLISHLGASSLSVDTVAKELNLGTRTLHRKLAEENTSFKEVKLSLKMDAAKNALINNDTSITELAQTLGYSDSSAFSRAFRQSIGISPLQYRKKYRTR